MGKRSRGPLPAEPITVRVHDLDDEARGVGVAEDGAEARLPGVLPDEEVTAEVVYRSGAGRYYARLEEVRTPAAERVEVPCPRFLACGGCDLLHASAELQLAWKRRQVAEALGLELERVEPTIASPRSLGYRAFAKLVVGPDGVLGSYAPRSHDVIDMRGCVVHAPEIEPIVEALRAEAAAVVQAGLRYVLVRGALAEGRAVVTLVSREPAPPGLSALVGRIAARPDVARVVLHVNDAEGDALLSSGPSRVLVDGEAPVERVGAVPQSLEAGAFAQINPGAAALLYARAVEDLEPAGECVLDLYAGSGGLGLSMAAAGASAVYGVEARPEAVRAAERAAEAMGVSDRTRFVAGAVEAELLDAPPSCRIVVNPPRKGLSLPVIEALAHRAELGPYRLVYVSCNPSSLARDLEQLGARVRLELGRVTPVDLFPQTRHVETVLVAEVGGPPA